MQVDLLRIPLLITGILVTVLGATILLFDARNRAYRAFGALMGLRGVNFIAMGLMTASAPALTGALLATQGYLLLPLIPLVAYFVSVFPTRRGPLAFRGSGWLVIVVIALIEFTYWYNHSTVFSLAEGAAGSGFEHAGPGWIYTGFGPLSLLLAGGNLAVALVGLAYAWEYVKKTGQPQLYLLVASGFILNGIFDGGLAAAALIEDSSLIGLSGYGLAIPILRALALLPAAIALGMILSTQLESRSRFYWVLPGLAVLALLSGPIPIVLGVSGYGLTWHSLIILSLWRLVMPVTVGYALIPSGMLEHVRLPHLWPRGHHKTAARPAASVRSTED